MENQNEKRLTLKQYQDNLMSETLTDLQVNMSRGIVFPKNYIPQNALMNAILYLTQAVDKNGKPVLSVCTRDSVKQAMLNMLQSGLNVGKNQGYFIAYGQKLSWFTSYFGHITQAKAADPNIADIYGEVVYKDDVFKYQIKHGKKIITEHQQEPENIDTKNIRGAYATILYRDGGEVSEYMTMEQIRRSWGFGQTKGGSSAHRETPEEMCKRTVINRLTKPIINSADDSTVIDEADAFTAEANENEGRLLLDVTSNDEYDDEPPAESQRIDSGATAEPEKETKQPEKITKPAKTEQKKPEKTQRQEETSLPEPPPEQEQMDDQMTLPFPD